MFKMLKYEISLYVTTSLPLTTQMLVYIVITYYEALTVGMFCGIVPLHLKYYICIIRTF